MSLDLAGRVPDFVIQYGLIYELIDKINATKSKTSQKVPEYGLEF